MVQHLWSLVMWYPNYVTTLQSLPWERGLWPVRRCMGLFVTGWIGTWVRALIASKLDSRLFWAKGGWPGVNSSSNGSFAVRVLGWDLAVYWWLGRARVPPRRLKNKSNLRLRMLLYVMWCLQWACYLFVLCLVIINEDKSTLEEELWRRTWRGRKGLLMLYLLDHCFLLSTPMK